MGFTIQLHHLHDLVLVQAIEVGRMSTNADSFCEIVEPVDVVSDASHVDMAHWIVAFVLDVVLV